MVGSCCKVQWTTEQRRASCLLSVQSVWLRVLMKSGLLGSGRSVLCGIADRCGCRSIFPNAASTHRDCHVGRGGTGTGRCVPQSDCGCDPARRTIAVALSLLLGAAAFSASNALLARFGAAHRKRCGDCIQQPAESQQPGSGVAIALGNALDAAPEAMVLGVACGIRGPRRADHRVLAQQPSHRFIESSGYAGCGS